MVWHNRTDAHPGDRRFINGSEPLGPLHHQSSNRVRTADRERHSERPLQRHSREKRCTWLLATPPVNFTSMDAESIGARLQRQELRLGLFIKNLAEKDDIEICALD